MTVPEGMFEAVLPFFATGDLDASIKYYCETLGFKIDEQFHTEDWAMMWADGCQLFLLQDRRMAQEINRQQFQVVVAEVETLYEIHQKNGAEIVKPLAKTSYGRLEYTVEDINGYHFVFGRHVGGG